MEPTDRWLKWAWHHYRLEVEGYPTLRDAVEAGHLAADDEALSHYEGPDGVVPKKDVADIARQIREEQQARREREPQITHVIKLVPLPHSRHDGAYATVAVVYAHDDAEAVAAPWRAVYGARIIVRAGLY